MLRLLRHQLPAKTASAGEEYGAARRSAVRVQPPDRAATSAMRPDRPDDGFFADRIRAAARHKSRPMRTSSARRAAMAPESRLATTSSAGLAAAVLRGLRETRTPHRIPPRLRYRSAPAPRPQIRHQLPTGRFPALAADRFPAHPSGRPAAYLGRPPTIAPGRRPRAALGHPQQTAFDRPPQTAHAPVAARRARGRPLWSLAELEYSFTLPAFDPDGRPSTPPAFDPDGRPSRSAW